MYKVKSDWGQFLSKVCLTCTPSLSCFGETLNMLWNRANNPYAKVRVTPLWNVQKVFLGLKPFLAWAKMTKIPYLCDWELLSWTRYKKSRGLLRGFSTLTPCDWIFITFNSKLLWPPLAFKTTLVDAFIHSCFQITGKPQIISIMPPYLQIQFHLFPPRSSSTWWTLSVHSVLLLAWYPLGSVLRSHSTAVHMSNFPWAKVAPTSLRTGCLVFFVAHTVLKVNNKALQFPNE